MGCLRGGAESLAMPRWPKMARRGHPGGDPGARPPACTTPADWSVLFSPIGSFILRRPGFPWYRDTPGGDPHDRYNAIGRPAVQRCVLHTRAKDASPAARGTHTPAYPAGASRLRAGVDRPWRTGLDLWLFRAGMAAHPDRVSSRSYVHRLCLRSDRTGYGRRLAAAALRAARRGGGDGVHAAVGDPAETSRRAGGTDHGSHLAGTGRDPGDPCGGLDPLCAACARIATAFPHRRPRRPQRAHHDGACVADDRPVALLLYGTNRHLHPWLAALPYGAGMDHRCR